MKLRNKFFSILFLICLIIPNILSATETEFSCEKVFDNSKALFKNIGKYLQTIPYAITNEEGKEICKHIGDMIYEYDIPLVEHPSIQLVCVVKEEKTIPVELHLKFIFICKTSEKPEIYMCNQRFKIHKNLSGKEV